MFPIRLERDTKIVNWALKMGGWPTATSASDGEDCTMRSDGVLNADYGLVQVKADTIAVPANRMIGAGVHMSGPLDGEEFTLYSYCVDIWTSDTELIPVFYVAVSPATITSDATGDLCEQFSLIGTADGMSTEYKALHREGVVALPLTDAVAAGRGVAFGAGLATTASASGTLKAYMRLSVRRLVANEPSILDTTKLG